VAGRPLSVHPVAAMIALAIVASVATDLVLPAAPAVDPAPRLLALVAPRSAVADERYVLYAGLSDLPQRAVVLVRICRDDGACPLERATRIPEGGVWWGWLGAFEVPAGSYTGRLFVWAPGRGGDRSIAAAAWSLQVHD
jgi:hypothetical protein